MKTPFLLLIPFIIVLSVFSCKKDEDKEKKYPEITIISPNNGDVYNVLDTIHVIANIAYDKPIISVNISLQSQDYITQVTSVGLFPDQSSFTLEADLVIDNDKMESGSYYLVIKVYDGNTYFSAYQAVTVNGIKRVFRNLLVISQPNMLKSLVSALDTNMNISNWFNIAHGYVDSDISSKHQQLYFISPLPSKLFTYDLKTKELDWEFAAGPPYPEFEDIYYNQDIIYLASQNGNLFGLNSSGNNQYVTPIIQNRIPEKIYRHYYYIITGQSKRNNLERWITLNYYSTGILAQEALSNIKVVEFFSRNSNEVFVFGNENNQGKILIYDLAANQFSEVIAVPSGAINAVISIDQENYLVAHEAAIYLYNTVGQTLSLYMPVMNVKLLTYEELSKTLYVVSDKHVKIYDYTNTGLIDIVTFDYSIVGILLHYNR
jgi:hypothetical protein